MAATITPDAIAPDTTTYFLVHRALRTNARRLADVTAAYDRQDPRRTRSLVRWTEGFIEELHCHHTIEDEVMFPALVAKVPEAAQLIARTDDDHAAMDRIVVRMETGVGHLRLGGSPRALHAAAVDLADLLDAHLAFEDEHVIPVFEQHFTAAEYQHLDDEAMKVLGVSKQAIFTVPFVLSAADPDEFDRAWGTAAAPFKVLYLASKGRYRRMTDRALGAPPVRAVEVAS